MPTKRRKKPSLVQFDHNGKTIYIVNPDKYPRDADQWESSEYQGPGFVISIGHPNVPKLFLVWSDRDSTTDMLDGALDKTTTVLFKFFPDLIFSADSDYVKDMRRKALLSAEQWYRENEDDYKYSSDEVKERAVKMRAADIFDEVLKYTYDGTDDGWIPEDSIMMLDSPLMTNTMFIKALELCVSLDPNADQETRDWAKRVIKRGY